ncbi:MAG: hypothetical protein HY673_14255 [Chloroflexi bacterium]|nr:hypothetical protein [Chloroflexota bacterium]
MRPSATEIIAGIKWSFETYIVPDLNEKLAQSTARSILCLLDHLQARVAMEGPLLVEDNQEMRELFQQLSQLLEPALRDGAAPDLATAVAEMKEKAVKEYRPSGTYPTVESLTEENEELKRTLVRVIQAVKGHAADLPADAYAQADEAIRGQLRRQLDRENAWISVLAGKRPF